MLLPLKSECLGKYSTESEQVWKSCYMDWVVDRPNILKRFIFLVLLIMDLAFIVPSHSSFPKLQLHVIKHFEIIFATFCFYLSAQKLRFRLFN